VTAALLLTVVSTMLSVVIVVILITRRGGVPLLERRIDGLERAIERAERAVQEESRHSRRESADAVQRLSDSLVQAQSVLGQSQAHQLDGFANQLVALRAGIETKVESLRDNVDQRLRDIQRDNAAKLEQMRQTVDEKLQSTLDARLGASFRQVSERLEQVYLGLGEMQALATGVGDLKRVLSNVKARGTWGEVHLAGLLEQVLAPEQYDVNVSTSDSGGERVEFAIRLPGRGEHGHDQTWLPLDSKFPLEDYHAVVDAADRGDSTTVEEAGRRLETRVKGCAKEISTKYLNPPRTTDFAIMFLPNEGLYAEVLRRPGLTEFVQREHRIVVAGPTTLWAILTSLQMGFRTLAIERRSSEVWTLLGAVKTEFGKFGTTLEAIEKSLDRAAARVGDARRGTRAIQRRLSDVEDLPATDAAVLLGAPVLDGDADEERLAS
jgi:DNA recombination protein RmuC